MTIDELYAIIKDRNENLPDGSYVTSLFKAGQDRIIQKVGEEATEVIIASKNKDKQRLISEVADLWFHALILMVSKKVAINDIYEELEKRNK